MKFGVNARLLAKPFTGIGQYTRYLFRELAMLDMKNEYILVVHQEVGKDLKNFFPKNVSIKVIPEIKRGSAGMKKTWWEQISIPEYFKKEKVDVAFFTYPSNPWTKDWYRKNGIKTVVTVHDSIPWKHEEYRRGFLSKMYHRQTRRAVGRADRVFTVSKSSKKDILKFCKVKSEDVKVVYNDVADEYKEKVDSGFLSLVLKKFDLKRGRYFVYCGGFDDRKNVDKLVKEYFRFANKAGLSKNELVPLVLVGGRLFDDDLYSSYDDFSGEGVGRVIKTGFVGERELAAFYTGALALVHLSKDEGFNIPVVEAANCGCPLILSDIDVHKEIAGKGARYVDYEKKGDCADEMLRMLDGGVRDDAVKAARMIAGDYLWERSAMRTLDVVKGI